MNSLISFCIIPNTSFFFSFHARLLFLYKVSRVSAQPLHFALIYETFDILLHLQFFINLTLHKLQVICAQSVRYDEKAWTEPEYDKGHTPPDLESLLAWQHTRTALDLEELALHLTLRYIRRRLIINSLSLDVEYRHVLAQLLSAAENFLEATRLRRFAVLAHISFHFLLLF